MIDFYSETDFKLDNKEKIRGWIASVITAEGYELGEISFIFCDDDYLLKLNKQFLNHDTLTDIISFDNSVGKEVHGEIYISIERVMDNAKEFSESFTEELQRVIIHGILHYCGYKDKVDADAILMRQKENDCLTLLRAL